MRINDCGTGKNVKGRVLGAIIESISKSQITKAFAHTVKGDRRRRETTPRRSNLFSRLGLKYGPGRRTEPSVVWQPELLISGL